MKLFAVACAAAVLLAGCTSSSRHDVDRGPDSYRDASVNYLACGVYHAKKLVGAKPGTDPYYAAISAKTSCAGEWLTLYKGIQKVEAPVTWNRIMKGYEKSFMELAISTAVEAN